MFIYFKVVNGDDDLVGTLHTLLTAKNLTQHKRSGSEIDRVINNARPKRLNRFN